MKAGSLLLQTSGTGDRGGSGDRGASGVRSSCSSSTVIAPEAVVELGLYLE